MDHVMSPVAARLGPRVGRLGSLDHFGSVAAGTAKVGIVTAGAVKAATLTEADHVEVVNQAFTLALVVDRQLGVPPVTGTATSVSVPAGVTGIQVAGRQGVPSVADRQPRVACDRKNISAHFVAAAWWPGRGTRDSAVTAVADLDCRTLGLVFLRWSSRP
jgi:hypothetical protein